MIANVRAVLVLAVVLAGSVALAQMTQKPAPTKKAVRYGLALAPGDPAPGFRGTGLDGRPLEVSYEGPAGTIVGFWSSNCVPCRVLSPTLQKLFVERGTAALQVVGVAVDTGPARVPPTAAKAFLQEHGGTYPVVRGTPEIENAWGGITVLPTTFLVGKDGRLVRRYMGADDAIMKGLLDDVEAYLSGRPLGEQPLPPEDGDAAAGLPAPPPAPPN